MKLDEENTTQAKQASDLNSEVLKFIEETGETIQRLETEKQALTEQLNGMKAEKVRLEKVAAASASTVKLSADEVKRTVQNFQNLALVTSDNAEKIASDISKDPNAVFGLMDVLVDRFYKLATAGIPGDLIESKEASKVVDKVNDESEDYHWNQLRKRHYS